MAPKSKTRVAQTPGNVTLTFGEKMLAGAIARGVSQTVLHPVDVIRTRLQARNVQVSWKPAVFIKGLLPQMILAVPAGAIQFLAFESAKDKLEKWVPDDKFSQARILVSGAFGALMAASCRVPQEVLKQRIQADLYPNLLVALKETIGKQGIGSLYKGSLATISRDVPWNALSFMFHGQGKAIFRSVKGRDPANDENLAIAGVAGAVAAIIMTPVDVVKTRIMTNRGGAAQGIIGTLRTIVAEEGAGTLMKGMLPRIVFLAPLAGITFSVYEAVAKNIRKRKAAAAAAALAEGNVGDVGGVLLRPGVLAKGERKITTFAMRFSSRPVRLASASSRHHGLFLGDYESSSRFAFSLPVMC